MSQPYPLHAIASRRVLVRRDRHQRDLGRLQHLHDAGVSIWLDTLSRDLLASD